MIVIGDITVQFYIGLALGLVLGGIVGFMIAKRQKGGQNDISAIQFLSILSIFGYIVLSFLFSREPNVIISVAMLATGYGLKGGEILEQLLERRSGK